jgi:hypothetical protein
MKKMPKFGTKFCQVAVDAGDRVHGSTLTGIYWLMVPVTVAQLLSLTQLLPQAAILRNRIVAARGVPSGQKCI